MSKEHTPPAQADAQGYLHRLKGGGERNISLPSQMDGAFAYQKLWPEKIEIVPLGAMPIPSHLVHERTPAGPAQQMHKLAAGLNEAIDYAKAEQFFIDYFVKNYPGPDTVIFDPRWHAPKLFAAALRCVRSATPSHPMKEED